jgi:hypothetical protein
MDAPFLKSPYGSVKMTIYFDIINLLGNYMMVNVLKNPYQNKPFPKKYNLNVHIKKIKFEKSPKNNYDMNL